MGAIFTAIVGKNIKMIRESIGLSQKDFSILTNISRASLIKIEAGETGYRLNLLDDIISFTNFTLTELSKMNLLIPFDYRARLLEIYNGNDTVNVILNHQPTLVYCIRFSLLTGNFLETPREIREITKFFADQGWYFKGNSIQIALKRMTETITIEKHATKGNTNLYSKIRT